MTSSVVSRYRRMGDYFSANWPLLWKSKVHLCFFFALLGAALALVLRSFENSMLEANKMIVASKTQTPPHDDMALSGYVGFMIVVILVAASLTWIRATSRALVLRSRPAARFSPQFTFVVIGISVILGGYLGVLHLLGLENTYLPAPRSGDQQGTSDIAAIGVAVIIMLAYTILLVLMVQWYSFRGVMTGLLTSCGVFLIVLVPLGLMFQAMGETGVVKTIRYTTFAIPLVALLAIAVSSFLQGRRSQLIRQAMILFTIWFPVLLLVLVGESGLMLLVAPPWNELTLLLLLVISIELPCWLSARLELLPERR